MIRIKSLCLSIGLLSVASAQSTNRPNIIYILADDLGYGDVGCYGQKIIKTPNIDRLASKGIKFTQHYAGSTVSSPSRSVLLTGLHTGHTYIRGNIENENGEGQLPLPANTYTLPRMLKKNGYTTGIFGKWGLGYSGSEGDPLNLGFDRFFGYNCQALAHNHYPYFLDSDREKILLAENAGEGTVQYAPDLIQKEALKFLKKNAEKPFFMFMSYTLPHAELTTPKDSIYELYIHLNGKPYKGANSSQNYKWGYKRGAYGSSEKPHADFASMVHRLDAYVGQLVKELEKLNLEKNTLIIFSSDNGPHIEGGADPLFFNSSGDLRGTKRDLYEGGIRVPMIVCWPGKIKAGTISNHISAFWDVLPTLKEIVNDNDKIKTDGISFLPTLLNKKRQKVHNNLYWEFYEDGAKVAIRKGKWKGVKLNYNANPTSIIELYNLETDVTEKVNVADKYPKVVKQLEKQLKKEHSASALFQFEWEKSKN